jgi:hypothetical protein
MLLAALVQASSSFNPVISQLSDPRNRPDFSKIGSRPYDSSRLAKRGGTIGGTLKPSDKFACSKIFQEVINNKDCLKNISTVVIGDGFKVPSPSIFGKEAKDETAFGESLFQHRILPKLKNAKVFLEITSIFSVGSNKYRLISFLADRSRVLCLRCCGFLARKQTRSTVHIRHCSSVHPEQLVLGCSIHGEYASIQLSRKER